jgi:hypothetical protein
VSLRIRGVVACGAVLLAWGCSSEPPEIDAPTLSAADARACRELVDALPDTLADHDRVDAAGDTEYGAAWGDPPIVLTCGVGPMDLSDVPSCAEVDGVGWLVPPDQAEGGKDATFTADGYRPRVRLHVPEVYLPEGGAAALTELAGPIKQNLKLVERCL